MSELQLASNLDTRDWTKLIPMSYEYLKSQYKNGSLVVVNVLVQCILAMFELQISWLLNAPSPIDRNNDCLMPQLESEFLSKQQLSLVLNGLHFVLDKYYYLCNWYDLVSVTTTCKVSSLEAIIRVFKHNFLQIISS